MFCAPCRRRSEEDGEGGEERKERERWGEIRIHELSSQGYSPTEGSTRTFSKMGSLLFNLKSFSLIGFRFYQKNQISIKPTN